jgi:nitrite reductase (NADH) large subunit
VKTSDEVIEITGAYFQYYRETANYLDRTSVWVEQMGLDAIKVVMEDKQKRFELNQRLNVALSVLKEPWKEVINNETIQKDLYEKVNIPLTTK